jgi:CDP-glucose 4,6-dehydratase
LVQGSRAVEGVAMTFWAGRRVLVTGHTGFKGSWLCEMLLARGAAVAGLALAPDTRPALFDQLALARRMDHALGDIRDAGLVAARVRDVRPEVVLHLAAQPLVRRSYRAPLETWSTNVMGTAHVLEAVRAIGAPCAVVVVTTDKVYENREWEHPYRETDPLGGHDPYSASKAGTELVAASWRKAFFADGSVRLATARAGNVIGGGDWSEDRILADLARAFGTGQPLLVRNRHAVRPWQHVLDPLEGYLLLAERLAGDEGAQVEDGFNFGPEPADQRSVGALVEEARKHWAGEWTDATDPAAPHEAGQLALSIERARKVLRWQPRWDFARAVAETVGWYRDVAAGADPAERLRAQVADFGAGR